MPMLFRISSSVPVEGSLLAPSLPPSPHIAVLPTSEYHFARELAKIVQDVASFLQDPFRPKPTGLY